MSANAKQAVGDLASPPTAETDRFKLAKIVVAKGEEYPYVVHSIRTGSRLAAFKHEINAESFIAHVSMDVLLNCR